jgi:hypothetical protein
VAILRQRARHQAADRLLVVDNQDSRQISLAESNRPH